MVLYPICTRLQLIPELVITHKCQREQNRILSRAEAARLSSRRSRSAELAEVQLSVIPRWKTGGGSGARLRRFHPPAPFKLPNRASAAISTANRTEPPNRPWIGVRRVL